MKKTIAIKNPVLLKKNTLKLEKDSISQNIYYIKFEYDALLDFRLNIMFNAIKNEDKSLPNL